MKIRQYLTEEWGPGHEHNKVDMVLEKFMKVLKKNCNPWLNAIRNCSEKDLWRGVASKGNVIKKKTRKDRHPMDMPHEIHDKTNDYFQKTFGWKGRSEGVFAFGNYNKTLGYGRDEYLIFPIGYKGIIWSPKINDLYLKRFSPQLDDYMKTYTNKDLCKALSSNNEIMVNCSGYYGISNYLIYDTSIPGNRGQTAKLFIEELY